MRHFAVRFTLAVIIGIGDCAIAQTVPHTFTPGAVIRANELNENFRALAGASAPKAVKLLVNGTAVGVVFGGEPPEITGITNKGFLFCYYPSPVNQQNSPLNFGNSRCGMFTPIFIYHTGASCTGIRYAVPSPDNWLSNGIVFQSRGTLLMIDPAQQSLVTIIVPLLSQDGVDGSCFNLPTPLSPGQPGYPSKVYAPLAHDSNVTGFPFSLSHPTINDLKISYE